MKSKAIFYHAGCPVCLEAEHNSAEVLGPLCYEWEAVHLAGQQT